MRTERDQRGETLVELLIAMSIVGITVVAIVGGIGTSIVMSDIHRKQSTAGVVVRTFAEAIESGVTTNTTDKYVACPALAYYETPAGFTAPSGFTPSVTAVLSWNGTAFVACTSDTGVQKIALRVASADTRAAETLDVIIRTP